MKQIKMAIITTALIIGGAVAQTETEKLLKKYYMNSMNAESSGQFKATATGSQWDTLQVMFYVNKSATAMKNTAVNSGSHEVVADGAREAGFKFVHYKTLLGNSGAIRIKK